MEDGHGAFDDRWCAAASTMYHFRVRSKDPAGKLRGVGRFHLHHARRGLDVIGRLHHRNCGQRDGSGTVTPRDREQRRRRDRRRVQARRGRCGSEDTAAPVHGRLGYHIDLAGCRQATATAWDAAGNSATATRTVTGSNRSRRCGWRGCKYRGRPRRLQGEGRHDQRRVVRWSNISVGNVTSYTVARSSAR